MLLKVKGKTQLIKNLLKKRCFFLLTRFWLFCGLITYCLCLPCVKIYVFVLQKGVNKCLPSELNRIPLSILGLLVAVPEVLNIVLFNVLVSGNDPVRDPCFVWLQSGVPVGIILVLHLQIA